MTLKELANFKTIPLSELEAKYPFGAINGYWGDLDELHELLEEEELEEEPEELEEVFYYKGDIHIKDNVVIEEMANFSYFFIDGNLTIDGTLSISVDYIFNVLGISGKLNVQNLMLGYDAILFVLDDVNIQNMMFATLQNGTCHFAKKATAKYVISDGVYDDLFADLYQNLSAEVIDFDEMINGYDKLHYDEILKLVLKGEKLV